jgi:hypothetical protein
LGVRSGLLASSGFSPSRSQLRKIKLWSSLISSTSITTKPIDWYARYLPTIKKKSCSYMVLVHACIICFHFEFILISIFIFQSKFSWLVWKDYLIQEVNSSNFMISHLIIIPKRKCSKLFNLNLLTLSLIQIFILSRLCVYVWDALWTGCIQEGLFTVL